MLYNLLQNTKISVALDNKEIASNVSSIEKVTDDINAAASYNFSNALQSKLTPERLYMSEHDVFTDKNTHQLPAKIKKQIESRCVGHFVKRDTFLDNLNFQNMSLSTKDSTLGHVVFYFFLMFLFFVSAKNHIRTFFSYINIECKTIFN